MRNPAIPRRYARTKQLLLPSHRWQKAHVRGEDDPLNHPPIWEDSMPDVRRPDRQEADFRPREDLLVTRDAEVRDGAALGRGSVRRLKLQVEDRRRCPHLVRPAPVVVI